MNTPPPLGRRTQADRAASKPLRPLGEVDAALVVNVRRRILHLWAVVRDQLHQTPTVVPAMFGDEAGDAEPTVALAAAARDDQHAHAPVRHIAEGDRGFHGHSRDQAVR
jgi:hypothetical protein